MKKKSTKIIIVGLACLLMYLMSPQPFALAAEDNQSATISKNIGSQNYSIFPGCVCSYLYQNNSDQFTRVEVISPNVLVETYDRYYNFLTTNTISKELELFGGFYAGKDYNFLIYGQRNPSEDDSQEVIRVVKYSKDWDRLGDASLYGANTTIPFDFGSLRCTEYNGILYIRTSHQMYKSSKDGLNHQANLTMSVRQSDMNITDSYYIVMNSSYGYVSHSFNQFIMVDTNSNLVALDHGDAYPRSAVLIKYDKKAGGDTISGKADTVNLIDFFGDIGDNTTGASLGGLSESLSSYLVAGNSVIQDSSFASRTTRNVFVTITNKDSFSTSDTQLIWLTNYDEDSTYSASTPHLVKISDDRFLVMWSQLTSSSIGNDSGVICYAFIDGSGNQISETFTTKGSLSDCEPVLVNDQVIWYVTNNSKPIFYSINSITGELKVSTHTITASAEGGGSISPAGDVIVVKGDSQTFTITANKGYEISDVIVNGNSVGAVSTFTFDDVTEDQNISAKFKAIYTIFASAEDGGSISPSGNINVSEGESQTFTITPNSGYKIANVTVDGESVGTISTYTFSNVEGNHNIKVEFTEISSKQNSNNATVKDKVTLNKSKASLKVGASITLKATGSGKVTYSTTNKKVATVSSSGKITAVKTGTASITATCGTAKATCEVTVKKDKIKISSMKVGSKKIKATKKKITAAKGKKITIKIKKTNTVKPIKVTVSNSKAVKKSVKKNKIVLTVKKVVKKKVKVTIKCGTRKIVRYIVTKK